MKLGNTATGADFFDRAQIRQDIRDYLIGEHINLRGVRRLGKSSLLCKIKEEAEADGFLVTYIDVGGCQTAEQFIEQLNQHLTQKSISQYVKNFSKPVTDWLKRIKNIKGGVAEVGKLEITLEEAQSAVWYAKAQALEKRLTEVPVIIQIDEFSVFLEKLLEKDVNETDALLSWLRAWRQSATACRFIFTGSIGLNYLLAQHQLVTRLNDCYEVILKPFKKKDALEMLKIEAEEHLKYAISNEVMNYLCNKVGWLSPYLLNLLLEQSRLAARDRIEELEITEQKITTADVDMGYEALVGISSRFSHWVGRLKKHLDTQDFNFCKDLLSHIAQSKTGLTSRQLANRLNKREPDPDKRRDKIQDLLAKLEDEGYLSPPNNKGRITFLSFLLQDYWKRRHAC